jgi:hypothetical protein
MYLTDRMSSLSRLSQILQLRNEDVDSDETRERRNALTTRLSKVHPSRGGVAVVATTTWVILTMPDLTSLTGLHSSPKGREMVSRLCKGRSVWEVEVLYSDCCYFTPCISHVNKVKI